MGRGQERSSRVRRCQQVAGEEGWEVVSMGKVMCAGVGELARLSDLAANCGRIELMTLLNHLVRTY